MAVLSTAEALFYLPELASGSETTNLTTLIARVQSSMSEWLGYPPASAGGESDLEDATYTLYSGQGLARVEVVDAMTLRLPVRPIVSVTSIEDDSTWAFDGSTYLVSSSDYVVRQSDGEIVLKPNRSHGAWSEGSGDLKVVVIAGYQTVPAWAKHAAGLWLKHWWNLRWMAGRESVGEQGVSASLRPETIPEAVAEVLRPYRIILGAA